MDKVDETGLEAPGLRPVLVLLGRHLLKNLAALIVPVGLVTAASVALCGTIGVLAILGRGAVILNDVLLPFEPSPGLAVMAVAMGVCLLVVQLGLTALVVVVVAGSVLGRPVSTARAARMVLRRSGALLVLFVVYVAVVALLLAIAAMVRIVLLGSDIDLGSEVELETLATWAGLIVAGLVAMGLWWLPLAVPLVMLKGTGPLRALSRAKEIPRGRRGRMFVRLMVTAVAIPAVLGAGTSWLESQFTGIEHNAAAIATVTVYMALGTVLQGAALAVVALDQRPVRSRPPQQAAEPAVMNPDILDLDAVAARFPEPASAPRTKPLHALPLVALTMIALLVPGLAYWGYLTANPHRLAAFQIQSVRSSDRWTEDGPLRGSPVLLDDSRLLVTGHSHGDHKLCSDRECDKAREVPRLPSPNRVPVRATALPDGSWAYVQNEDMGRGKATAIALRRCTEDECTHFDEAPPIATVPDGADSDVMVKASGRDVLVAVLTDTEDRRRAVSTLRLLRCASVPCGKPRLLAEFNIPEPHVSGREPIGLATRAGGRPVVAYEDSASGAVTLFICQDRDCRRIITRRPVGRASAAIIERGGKDGARHQSGVRLAVPPDNRPVLVHRDLATGASRLLRCRTPDCAEADAIIHTDPSTAKPVADLALGPGGLPTLASFDVSRRMVVLIACAVPDCSRRDTVDLGTFDMGSPGTVTAGDLGVLDLAVGRDGRPRVLWNFTTHANLLTCRDTRCGS
ncbi:hypothetical protein [Actinomadura sp. 3N407]|uniref:hypothetical protein n=1 Tax=Actinomadura sp. 3N407 TaxID=3457423 RepID=UPI003FCE77DE